MVDPEVAPRFCKAKPYAMRSKLEDEIEMLVKEGTLEPSDYADLGSCENMWGFQNDSKSSVKINQSPRWRTFLER